MPFKEIKKPRTVKCDRKGCNNTHTEHIYGDGAIGWQHILWIQDENGKYALLCPECTKTISDFILGRKKEVD